MKQTDKVQMLNALQRIPGVGKRIADDFWEIGLRQVSDLKDSDPEKLYLKLCAHQHRQVDRCMLYVFRCAVYYASHTNHEPEKLQWWYWKDHK